MAKDSWQRFEDECEDFFVIEGIASTDAEDAHGEIIKQKGIDLSFVDEEAVTINLEHGEGFPFPPISIVGIVTDAEIREEGLWIRAKIYKQHPYGDMIYREFAAPIGSLQFSVELTDCIYGKGNKSHVIRSGVLTAVALTKDPANSNTYAELVKSSNLPMKYFVDEIRRLNDVVKVMSQRQKKKKRVIVRVLRVK